MQEGLPRGHDRRPGQQSGVVTEELSLDDSAADSRLHVAFLQTLHVRNTLHRRFVRNAKGELPA
jgi:hypothetical protein